MLPGFSIFGQGTRGADEPIYAILFTYLLSQITLLLDINQIASFITMTYLMTFFATNLACFLLKIGSAPNFRPSFRYFTWWTAGLGAVVSGIIMFLVRILFHDIFNASCRSPLTYRLSRWMAYTQLRVLAFLLLYFW